MIGHGDLEREFENKCGDTSRIQLPGGGWWFSSAYIHWLENLVRQSRTRPDLAPYQGDELDFPSCPEV